MKSILSTVVLVMITTALIAQTAPLKSSDSYKPATFEDPERITRLQKAFPVIDKLYRDHAEKNHFPGFVYGIVADGKLVFSGATGVLNTKTQNKATTQSLFRIASMTKSFTAMAIMKLQDDGKLNVTDAASEYVSEMKAFVYATSDTRPITIHNLLTMTAGFPEDNPWGDRQLEDTDAEFLAFLKNGVSFSSTPGQQFEYSNLGYAILGNIVTRVSGMPYQDYITKNILQPLGMNNTYWEYSKVKPEALAIGYRWEDDQWKEEPMLHDGAYGAMGGLITSLEDFSKYVAFHLSAYPLRNEEERGPVKRSSVREMHKPYMPVMFETQRYGKPCPALSGYGYGLGHRKDCRNMTRISHSGGLPGFGSEYRFYPDHGIGVISFANRTYAGTGAINARVMDTLMFMSPLEPRVLPPSDILNKRKEQLASVLTTWDEKQENAIFAENFFLDKSRDRWIKESKEVFDKVIQVISVGPMEAENQLRGHFRIKGKSGAVLVFFTLTPEKDPKIQQLDIEWEAPH
jgi:CubicO group peptidase (beta-lactamase class C family)